ncbi:16491_t:CDS:1, partial [Dentiscutata erythropus]
LALSNPNEDENSKEDEKSMWKNIENELEKIQIEELGYDHPLCSGILDDSSKPFTEEDKKVFKAPSRKFLIQHDETLKDICKKFVLGKTVYLNYFSFYLLFVRKNSRKNQAKKTQIIGKETT